MRLPENVSFTHQAGRLYLAGLACPALLALAAGCTELGSFGATNTEPVVRAAAPQKPQETPRMLPPPETIQSNQPNKDDESKSVPPAAQLTPAGRLSFSANDPNKVVPINLETVLRLAETQNGQTSVALEKLREAFAQCDVASKGWLPDFWVGAGWYRHEGGIADFQGNLINSSYGSFFSGLEVNGRLDLREAVHRKMQAARRVWQQRAEVAKLSTEALQEGSGAYVDLLAARAAEAVSTQVEGHLNDLLQQTISLAKTLPSAEVDVARIQADLHGQQQLIRKFREASVTAAAKLLYLLGLDPTSELAVMDRNLVAFTLVNADLPADELVLQAEQNGPAIRELEGLLQLGQEAQARSTGLGQMMPVFDLRFAEGGFGTGPGSTMDWDNRWDLGVQMRWNLTDWVTRRDRQRALHAQLSQAQISYLDLRAKLTMGVQETREAIHSGRDQMDIGLRQVKHATDAFERSRFRFTQTPNVKERSPSEVLLALRSLNASNLAYLLAIRDHDKAQLRLAILTGAVGGRFCN